MSVKVAINGLGRIGRAILKLVLEEPELELVAVNDLVAIENLAYLLRFDTVYGRYPKPVVAEGEYLAVDGHAVRTLKNRNPLELPWKALGVELVQVKSGTCAYRLLCLWPLFRDMAVATVAAPWICVCREDARVGVTGVRVYRRAQAARRSREACRRRRAVRPTVGAVARRGNGDGRPRREFTGGCAKHRLVCELHDELHHADRGSHRPAHRVQKGR